MPIMLKRFYLAEYPIFGHGCLGMLRENVRKKEGQDRTF